MDIYLGGEGFSFRIIGSTAQEHDRHHFIKPEKVEVTIKNLDIRLKKSKHKLLFTMFRPLLFRVVRPAIQKAIEKQIRDSFTKADAFGYEIHTEAQRSREASRTDPEDKRSMYAHYLAAARKKMAARKEEAKRKAEQVQKRDTKVNMAVTQHDSIFKNVKLPGGISTKATEYKELAEKGDRWESPVFGIGSASQTTDLPRLGPITRKPHRIDVRSREQEEAERAAAAHTHAAPPHRAAAPPAAHAEHVGFASQPPTTYPSLPIAQPTHAIPAVPGGTFMDGGSHHGARHTGYENGGTTGGYANGAPRTIPGTKAPIQI